jgi:hypothetical protein
MCEQGVHFPTGEVQRWGVALCQTVYYILKDRPQKHRIPASDTTRREKDEKKLEKKKTRASNFFSRFPLSQGDFRPWLKK